MNLHRMKKIILILLLAIPVLIEAQNVMTETRQVLISPDGAYRFTFYQRALGKDNTRMYYTLTYKDRPVVEESWEYRLRISCLSLHWPFRMILAISGVKI